MKKRLKEISAAPSKRIYRSIIADYHLYLSLCELIDNALDSWNYNGRQEELQIDIDLDYDQQSIMVKDNAGGIKEQDISLIVGPGQSRVSGSEEIIGVFGVGSKRAVAALSKQIKILSRHSNQKTILLEIDNDWLEEEDNWSLIPYEVDNIEENTTQIELSNLREKIEEDEHQDLLERLGAVYALFLEAGGVKIVVNEDEVAAKTFENWSFPPDFVPQEVTGPIKIKDREDIQFSITGGLTKSHKDSDSSGEEYGVYFYCNNRLIARAYKGKEVGFYSPFTTIGKPHPSMSLMRVIVKLTGEVDFMPWNSSKSAIDFKHRTFIEIASHIKKMLVSYATMSKRFSNDWPEKVFQYKTGTIRRQVLEEITKSIKIHVPIVKHIPKQPKYIGLATKKWTIS